MPGEAPKQADPSILEEALLRKCGPLAPSTVKPRMDDPKPATPSFAKILLDLIRQRN